MHVKGLFLHNKCEYKINFEYVVIGIASEVSLTYNNIKNLNVKDLKI